MPSPTPSPEDEGSLEELRELEGDPRATARERKLERECV